MSAELSQAFRHVRQLTGIRVARIQDIYGTLRLFNPPVMILEHITIGHKRYAGPFLLDEAFNVHRISE